MNRKGRNECDHRALSGSPGKDLYTRTARAGRTSISRKPDFGNRQFSEAQLNVPSRMKQAAEYTKVVFKENPMYVEESRRDVEKCLSHCLP